jgi:putative SOS response-associated peptidase YedK
MCGKFTQMASWADVVAFSMPLVDAPAADNSIVVATPMRFASILRLNAEGQREVVQMRWGFADMKSASPARPKHMHARAETIDDLPTFAHAFANARGILLVQTFNEGEELPNGRTKQWVITPKDGQPIAMAVICEEWRNGEETLWTFVQITTPANAVITPVTDRMPAILRREDWAVWLGETGANATELKALLRTYDDAGGWDIAPQEPNRPQPDPRQPDLF